MTEKQKAEWFENHRMLTRQVDICLEMQSVMFDDPAFEALAAEWNELQSALYPAHE
ncbi:hypothetical protein SAMN04487969_1554 [Paenibacillus algorifonticola]|uniref:Uncharacterized protein n=1 Tax=Paenibacillus algorifonticola TaxID=684063 RepID=A0A1I2J9F1_9BACL|nr:hypothetical protein [Paenibacillus algorifonticola]SFF49331.1 hypothetical protein SAMN04487969_1554 [Paenibacillus algorifonticola]